VGASAVACGASVGASVGATVGAAGVGPPQAAKTMLNKHKSESIFRNLDILSSL
jgi:hypothetical protein